MINRFAPAVIVAIFLQFIPSFAHVQAEEVQEGIGEIQITQTGPSKNALGNWTLIQPDNSKVMLDKKYDFTFSEAHSGKYVLLIEKANGTSIELKTYKNDQLIDTTSNPQITFYVSKDDKITIKANYTYAITGTVGISSTPPNIPFELQDPNGTTYTGNTPASFADVPIGIYSVKYIPPKTCPQPARQSDQLLENGRISFSIELSCKDLDNEKTYEKQLQYVTLIDGNKTIILEDAPIEAWFAPYVHTVAKTGIMSGYRDSNGNYTGKFKPANPVSIAQLVKVAHEVAGINEAEVRGIPANTQARNTWFSDYYTSAEQNHWQVYKNTRLDPSRNATRSEVITTLLQAMNAPRIWPQGKIFSDVSPDTPYSASIETAALDKIINVDSSLFRPNDSINRAELAKIITMIIDTYIEDSPEFTGESH